MFATKSQKRGAQRKLISLKDRPFPGEDYKAGASLKRPLRKGSLPSEDGSKRETQDRESGNRSCHLPSCTDLA